jgi:hypothetical protein
MQRAKQPVLLASSSLTETTMTHRFQSAFAFTGTVAFAALAATIMVGSARAEGPIEQNAPFVGSRSAAEVRAEVLRDRAQLSSAAVEWNTQLNEPRMIASGTTREQLRAEYIASRDQVQAMNSEAGGSGYIASRTVRSAGTVVARTPAQ